MMNILILTDNEQGWIARLQRSFAIDCIVTKRRDTTIITSGMFKVEIRDRFPEASKGKCFSCAILDKYIDRQTEDSLIRPCVKTFLQKTQDYFKNRTE